MNELHLAPIRDCLPQDLFQSSIFIDLGIEPQTAIKMEQRPNDSTPHITEPVQASSEPATATDALLRQAAKTEGHADVEAFDNQHSNTPTDKEFEGGAIADGRLNGTASEKNSEGKLPSEWQLSLHMRFLVACQKSSRTWNKSCLNTQQKITGLRNATENGATRFWSARTEKRYSTLRSSATSICPPIKRSKSSSDKNILPFHQATVSSIPWHQDGRLLHQGSSRAVEQSLHSCTDRRNGEGPGESTLD